MNPSINVQDTYVEGFAAGYRFVVEPFHERDGQAVVILQGKQTKTMHDGEEFVNLGLSWLPANEAEQRFGRIIADMVALSKTITKDVCGSCGHVQERKTMFHQDGTDKCEKCAKRGYEWTLNFFNTVNTNRAKEGMAPVSKDDLTFRSGLTMYSLA